MKDNPDLVQKYHDIIKDQLRQGIIEKVRIESNYTLKYYIPNHEVVNPTKVTTKVRIVYDASAKTKPENNSLNEFLYSIAAKLNRHLFSFLHEVNSNDGRHRKNIFIDKPSKRC